jgi:hypothetical protein
MERDMIPAEEFCTHHHISYTFISGLQEAGLIEIVTVEEQPCLHTEQLRQLEKLVRLHTDMDINMEGIEAIAHLLQRMDDMQQRMNRLSQRLRIYEGD